MKENGKNKSMRSEFLRYVNREMSSRERNLFERKILQDGFTDEALDGYSELPAGHAEIDLPKLDKRLRYRVSRRSAIIFYRIAASVAVLLVLSTVFIVLTRRAPSEEIALVTNEAVTMDISKAEVITEAKVPFVSDTTTKDLTIAENIVINDEELPAEQQTLIADANEKKADLTEIAEPVVITKSLQANAEKPLAMSEQSVALSGRVAGVSVNKAVEARGQSDIMSEADSMFFSLNEVVVVGYGTLKEAGNEFTGYSAPVPAGGKRAFEDYISANLRKPASLIQGQKALVVLSITVRSNSIIENIKIVRSPGEEFSAEAIRLIKEGPAWQSAENNGEKIDDDVRIRIVFR